ncbi:helix-turn-helix transcriptional regulator [Chitinophaga lutea]
MTPKNYRDVHTIATHAFFADHAGDTPDVLLSDDDALQWDPLQALLHFQVKAAPGTRIPAVDTQRLQDVKDYLREAFLCPDLSLDGLCRRFGLNEFKLKKGFKQLFGYTVFGYVQDMKMKLARRLLTGRQLNVSEVADKLGYSSPNHFSAAFKKIYGFTPSRLYAFEPSFETPKENRPE